MCQCFAKTSGSNVSCGSTSQEHSHMSLWIPGREILISAVNPRQQVYTFENYFLDSEVFQPSSLPSEGVYGID